MKIDQAYLQKILEAFESEETHNTDIKRLHDQGFENGQKFRTHLEFLRDEGFIDGGKNNELGIQDSVDGQTTWSVVPLRMTSAGYHYLKDAKNKPIQTPTIPRLIEKLENRYQQVLSTSYGTCVSDRADFLGLIQENGLLQDIVNQLPVASVPENDIHVDQFGRYIAFPENGNIKEKAGYCWSAISKYDTRESIQDASNNFHPGSRDFSDQIRGLFEFLFTPPYNYIVECLKDIQAESSMILNEYLSSEIITEEAKNERMHAYLITLSAFHPRIREIAASLVRNGHYRQAIHDSYIALEQAVREKAGQGTEKTGMSLMQHVFNAGNFILKTADDRNERQGFMFLFAGAMGAIRNERSHRITDDTDPSVTLELLSFASMLFRILDKAESV